MHRFASTLIALAALFLVRAGASGSTLNVPGTYPNIQAALDSASNGDVILVAPGTYTQNLTFKKIVSLRSTNGPASTIIHVNGGVAVSLGGPAEISGFTITGARSDFGAGIVVGGVGTLIKNNIFDSNVETAGGYGAAIGGNSASPIIDSNLFTHNSADGQHLSGVVSFINGTNAQITNNIFVDNPTRAINLVLPDGTHSTITNNTFVRNTTGLRFASFSGADIRNNIFYGNASAYVTDYPGLVPSVDHNLFFANTTNFVGNAPNSALQIFADPHFAGVSDFHLLGDSSAIDAGGALFAPNHDFDGRARPYGGAYDIGAFEAVPEPSTFSVAAICFAVSGLIRRRRS